MARRITIEDLIALHEDEFAARHGRAEERRRPPNLAALRDFIAEHFAERYEARMETWGETPYRKVGRLIRYTGKRREGPRLVVVRRGGSPYSRADVVLDHRSTATYATNWDVVRWIVAEHRRISAERAEVTDSAGTTR